MSTTKNATLVPEFVLQRMIVRGTSSSKKTESANVSLANGIWQFFLMATLR